MSLRDLQALPFLQVLDLDPRPTFVIDLHSKSSTEDGFLRPVFFNRKIKSSQNVYNRLVLGVGYRSAFADEVKDFQTWSSSASKPEEGELSRFHTTFCGQNWLSFVVMDRWKVVCASVYPKPPAPPNPSPLQPAFPAIEILQSPTSPLPLSFEGTGRRHSEMLPSSPYSRAEKTDYFCSSTTVPVDSPMAGQFVKPLNGGIIGKSTFVKFVREHDWSSTPLGPIRNWPSQLVQTVNLILANPQPALIFWGSDLVSIYNEASLPVISERHPTFLGSSVITAYSEVWESNLRPIFSKVIDNGEAANQTMHLSLTNQATGCKEEKFFDVSYIPLFGPQGNVVGILELFFETTESHLSQRRTKTLLQLKALMAPARTMGEIWDTAVKSVDTNIFDIPQLLIFALDWVASSRNRDPDDRNRCNCLLKASVGFDSDSNTSFNKVDLFHSDTGLAPAFRKAMDGASQVRLRRGEDASLISLWDAVEDRAFGDQTKELVIVPVRPTSGKDAIAFLVIGLNPRSKFDPDYQEFVDLLSRQIASSAASTILLEEEIRRGRTVAENSAYQLRLRIQEAEAHELRFARFAEHAPIGICTFSCDGSKVWANQFWHELCGVSQVAVCVGQDWWHDNLYPGDVSLCKDMFKKLISETTAVFFELRLRGKPDDDSSCQPVWCLCSAYPEVIDGKIQSVVGIFTDISELKRVEDIQAKRADEAIESRRQQENFIDITSHEIRNPLSAVLQCSEEIISICGRVLQYDSPKKVELDVEILKNILDAAETVEYCTLHQKRIVDDVLILSKMDAGLLPMTPDAAQPLAIVNNMLKIFSRELRTAEIHLKFRVHESFTRHAVDWVQLDPSRFSQMIINLVGNAIKFTRAQARRSIEVQIAASPADCKPSNTWPINYMPRRAFAKDDKTTANKGMDMPWSEAQAIDIHFCVTDTGNGMTSEEQKLLFARFSQASPRTHVQYGGSGLGLYIVRALAELHGGQIGFTSTPGIGSTFGFFVKAGRCNTPPEELSGTRRNSITPHAMRRPTLKRQPSSLPEDEAKELAIKAAKRISQVNIPRLDLVCLPPSSPMTMCPTSTITLAAPAPVSAPKFTVLLVEDNVINQKVLKRQLSSLGHTVLLAHHGGEALELLKTTQFWKGNSNGAKLSFILSDVEMPVMDGITCARRIRELEATGDLTAHVPIVAITGNARPEKVQSALEAGMDEVVLKPFTVAKLMRTMTVKRLHEACLTPPAKEDSGVSEYMVF